MRSILKAASYDFDTAVFGHGKALMTQANNKLGTFRNPLIL